VVDEAIGVRISFIQRHSCAADANPHGPGDHDGVVYTPVVVQLHRHGRVARGDLVHVDAVIVSAVEAASGALGERVQGLAVLVPEAECGDPAGQPLWSAAAARAVGDFLPKVLSLGRVGAVKGLDEPSQDGFEQVMELGRLGAEVGDFVQALQDFLPVGLDTEKGDGGDAALELECVVKVLLQRAHHDDGGDDLVRLRRCGK